jgi:hypothetical protein
VTDAELVSLAVAQEMMGIGHDADFLPVISKRVAHPFPRLPEQPGDGNRRQQRSDLMSG